MNNRREDIDDGGISGGRFIHPGYLPAVRGVRIQGGRFVNPGVLPPERVYRLQSGEEEGMQSKVGIDWNYYHFGSRVGSKVNARLV